MNNKEQKTILLVDDEAIVAMDLSMKLKEYGYNVIQALTGQKAIEAVSNNKTVIDLILMDINLGEEIDGTETAKIILKDHDTPILFHSNHTEREVVNRTENITSYGYVVKNGITVLDASIKMAFRLHDAYVNLKNQKKNIDYSKQLYKELQDKEYVRYDDLPLETFDGNIIHVEFVSNVYLVDSDKV